MEEYLTATANETRFRKGECHDDHDRTKTKEEHVVKEEEEEEEAAEDPATFPIPRGIDPVQFA